MAKPSMEIVTQLRIKDKQHTTHEKEKKWQYNCREGQADFVKRLLLILLLILKRYIEVKCSNQVGMTAKWGGNFYNLPLDLSLPVY